MQKLNECQNYSENVTQDLQITQSIDQSSLKYIKIHHLRDIFRSMPIDRY